MNKEDNNHNNVEGKTNDPNTLFPVNTLLNKTKDNLAKAEAMVDEKPLITENSYELLKDEKE